MRKQQLTIALDRRVVEKLDSHAVKKSQKRGEAIESLLCERFGIILIQDKVALSVIKEKDEEIASLQNQLNVALAAIEAVKNNAEPRRMGVVKQLPADSDRFTMDQG